MNLNYLCNSFFKYFSLTAYILISGCVAQDQSPAQIHLDLDESLFQSNTTFPLKKDKIPTTTTINLEPRIFTLNQAVQTALKADPRIMSAMENINQAEADLITAGLIPHTRRARVG
jgi:outer membrane protein, heavy metal efflux system